MRGERLGHRRTCGTTFRIVLTADCVPATENPEDAEDAEDE
jgi:hypothetical protein